MKDQSKIPMISKEIAKRYLIAREYLKNAEGSKLTTREDIAKQAGVSVTVISNIENCHISKPNSTYTQFLVDNGINYYYLCGKSSDMLANAVSEKSNENSEVVESLKDEIKDLKRTVSILLGELERLKKELSQSRTIPMTDHGYHQLPEVQVGKHKTVNNDWGLWKNGNLLKKAI